MRELFAYLDGVRVGTVAQSRQGALTFTYAEEYLRGPRPTPLFVLTDRGPLIFHANWLTEGFRKELQR